MEPFGSLIYSYTRAQAIADGALIDVSAPARATGITFPCAITAGAWAECVAVSPELEGIQDQRGRLHDVLWMLYLCAKGRKEDRVDFIVSVARSDSEYETVRLYALCGPGDECEPVITIMLPGED